MANDLDNPINCACFNVRRAARQITQAYDLALKPVGIQATQFSLLAMVAGSDGGAGIALTTLAKRLGMDRTTLTRNLAVAERAKWLVVRQGDDRRERLIGLTGAGRRKLRAAEPYWQEAQRDIQKKIGTNGISDLLSISRRLDAN